MSPLISRAGLPAAVLIAFAAPAFAAEGKIDPADTAFMIAATALVLLMTLPGLALFYGGMVRAQEHPGDDGAERRRDRRGVAVVVRARLQPRLSRRRRADRRVRPDALLTGIGVESVSPFAKTIPEMLFMAYQMTFAVITCALVGGAVADRHEVFRLSRSSARCGCSSSTSRPRTGCGAAASWRASA